jgi:hypothetical protein
MHTPRKRRCQRSDRQCCRRFEPGVPRACRELYVRDHRGCVVERSICQTRAERRRPVAPMASASCRLVGTAPPIHTPSDPSRLRRLCCGRIKENTSTALHTIATAPGAGMYRRGDTAQRPQCSTPVACILSRRGCRRTLGLCVGFQTTLICMYARSAADSTTRTLLPQACSSTCLDISVAAGRTHALTGRLEEAVYMPAERRRQGVSGHAQRTVDGVPRCDQSRGVSLRADLRLVDLHISPGGPVDCSATAGPAGAGDGAQQLRR